MRTSSDAIDEVANSGYITKAMRGCDFQQSCLHTLSLKATALPALSGDPAFTDAFLGLSANPGALEYETVPSRVCHFIFRKVPFGPMFMRVA